MNGHDRFLDLVAAAIDFDLSPVEQATLERHLTVCAACRRDASAFRSDAQALAALPTPPLAALRSEAILTRVLTPPRTAVRLRALLLAALVALLAATVAFAVGAELLRRSRAIPIIPPPLVLRETPLPSRPVPSELPPVFAVQHLADIGAIRAAPMDAASGPEGQLVVAGSGECFGPQTCNLPFIWAESVERGIWSPMGRADADSDYSSVTIEAVAGGTQGFVAIGRGCVRDLSELACIWRLSDAIETWELLPKDLIFERAALKAVAATPYGWMVGGGVYPDRPPRAAIWWSPDGRTWERVPDGPVFDVGGQRDVGQGPDDIIVGGAGIDGLASDGTTVVAVGRTCDETGGRCSPAAWASGDGRIWTRSSGLPSGPEVGSLGIVVATSSGYVAVGRMASPDVDPFRDGRTFVVRSDDGRTWRPVTTTAFSGPSRPVAAAAVDDGLAVVTTQGSSLTIVASHDGVVWETVHEQTWEPVVITRPGRLDPTATFTVTTRVEGIAMTERQDGSAIVVGSVVDPPDGSVRSRFVYRVALGPADPSRRP